MSIALECFYLKELFAMPDDVLLSVTMTVGGCR
jgi:hypothetical protein